MAPQDPVTPPIKDTDGNHRLTGQELLDQLNAERPNPRSAGPNEKIHALLERAGMLDLANQLTAQVRAQGPDGAVFEAYAFRFQEQLDRVLDDVNARLKKNPNYRNSFEEEIRADGKAHGAQDADIDKKILQMRTALDFAETFKDTFKKGIRIDAEDVPALLEHFGLGFHMGAQPGKPQGRG